MTLKTIKYWSDEDIKILIELSNKQVSVLDMSKVLNRTVESISQKRTRLKLTEGFGPRSKLDDVSEDEFIHKVKCSNSLTDLMRNLNYSVQSGRSRNKIQKKINDLNLNTDHFNKKYKTKVNSVNNNNVLIKHSKHSNNFVKKIILKDDLIQYACNKCGLLDKWNGMTITLQLDHINGDNKDNRLENLRFLCPNCHSQTQTYGSKNIKFRQRAGTGLSDFTANEEHTGSSPVADSIK